MSGRTGEIEEMKGAFETEADHMHYDLVHESDDLGGDDMQEAAGTIYVAVCQDCPGDPIFGGWHGPRRKTREEAQADADDHNQANPGHRAAVL